MSSKDSPRSTTESSKSGRLAMSGRTSKEYSRSSTNGDAVFKRSHDHLVKSASKEPKTPRISNDHVKSKPPQMKTIDRNSSTENVGRPQVTSEKVLHRLKDDREREILNQSLKRTKVLTGGEDSKVHQHRLKDDIRERDVLNQSLKRTKGGEDSKGQHGFKDDRERNILNQSLKRTKVTGGEDLQHRLKDGRERDILNQSLKRTHVRDPEVDFRMLKRHKGERLEAGTKTPQVIDSKVRHEKPRPSESLTLATKHQRVTGDHLKVVKKETTSSTKELPQVKGKDHNERNVVKPIVTARKEEDVKKGNLAGDRKRPMGVKIEEGKDVRVRSVTKIEPVIATSNSTSKNVCI